jgi:hypothetical protein
MALASPTKEQVKMNMSKFKYLKHHARNLQPKIDQYQASVLTAPPTQRLYCVI